MRLNLSIKTICSITGAALIDPTETSSKFSIQNIVIDSRAPHINSDTLFVLFQGNKTKGGKYVPQFQEKGGQIVLTAEKLDRNDLVQLVVESPLRALQAIAKYHREQFNIPVIGITGSNGKTTVKEWLYHVLKKDYTIVRSPKSYNSQIGVALSVLEMDESHNLALFEAGISQPGEMEHLQRMIQPTIGVFTGIGDAHNNGFPFENPEEIKKAEKFLLFKEVKELIEYNGAGYTYTNRQSGLVKTYESNRNNGRLAITGAKEFDFALERNDKASEINASLVVLTASLLNLKNTNWLKSVETLPAISMRLEKMTGLNGNLLINDVYSLDEKSLEIGLQYLDVNKEGKATAIFIAEDGGLATKESSILNHLAVIRKQIGVGKVVYFGTAQIAEGFNFVDNHYASVTDYASQPINIENTAILFTGSRNSHLEVVVNAFTAKKHITRLVVNLMAVRKNLTFYRKQLSDKTGVLAMVKAQSYGSGILEMARLLEQENVNYFGVAYADEGVVLRKGGIKTPILVMNPEPAAFDDMIDHELEPSIYSPQLLNAFIHQLILRQKRNYPIHLKLDTGMNRLGFRKADFKGLTDTLSTQPEVFVQSVFSHLSVADMPEEKNYTEAQIDRFIEQTQIIEEAIGYSFLRHLANSAGTLYYPNAHFDMVRVGIGLFGLVGEQETDFEPVLALKSRVSQIRRILPGESVGYSRAFKADKETTIAIVPVGYSDGLRRALGNGKWSVVVNDKHYPIIGNVCMDMCMIDLGKDLVEVGDDVELFGPNNSIYQMSKVMQTIPYEIISSISSRVQRIYVEE